MIRSYIFILLYPVSHSVWVHDECCLFFERPLARDAY